MTMVRVRLVVILNFFLLQSCGTEECMRYIECITCLYTIVDGAIQETGAESCAAICAAENATVAAENATVAADTISGQDDSQPEGTISCFATIEGQCSGIPFYVRPNNGSADILVSNSPTGKFFGIVQQGHFAMIECTSSKWLYLLLVHA